jgi:hypothetical protein
MEADPGKAEPPKPKRRFQFRLRTLFVVMTALSVLLAQWPLVEWEPIRVRGVQPYGGVLLFWSRGDAAESSNTIGGYCVLPARVLAVASAELAALVGWLIRRRLRRPATQFPATTATGIPTAPRPPRTAVALLEWSAWPLSPHPAASSSACGR